MQSQTNCIPQKIYKYNPLRTPCNWTLAQDHAKATKLGKILHSDNLSQVKTIAVCPCCFNPIQKIPISICSSLNQIAQFGCGYPLFYSFLKFCILSLLVLIANSSLVLLYNAIDSNLNDNFNIEQYSASRFTVTLSTVNVKILDGQFQLISVISFCSQLFLLFNFRKQIQIQLKYIYQPKNINQSLYSIILYNLPQGNDNNQQKIQNFLQRIYTNIKINSILPILSLTQYNNLQKQIKQYLIKWKKLLTQQNKNNQQMLNMLKFIKIKSNQLKKKSQMIKCNQRIYFNGIAIVTFQNRKDKYKLLNKIQILQPQILEEFFDNVQKDKKIKVYNIQDPCQINWQNIHYTKDQRQSFQGLGNIIMIVILAGFFLLYFFLQYFFHMIKHWKHQEDTIVHQWNIAPSIICMFLVAVVNKFAMVPIVHKICQKQRHRSMTDQMISFSRKLSIGYFLTTAVMVIFVQGIIYQNLIESFGIIQEETLMFIINAFFISAIWLINPWYISHCISKYFHHDRKSFSQSQANKTLQFPQYNIGKRYADLIKTLWFTFMYANLIPIGPIISFVGLCSYYWIDKYNLLRKSSLQKTISIEITKEMIWLAQFTLIIKPLGNMYFIYMTQQTYSITEVVMFIIGIIYISVPIGNVINKMFPQSPMDSTRQEQQPISIAINKFHTLYELQYPILASTSKKLQFLNRLSKVTYIVRNYQELQSFEHSQALEKISIVSSNAQCVVKNFDKISSERAIIQQSEQ